MTVGAGDSLSDYGIPVWRGAVNAWDCDTMGHMNMRHYLAIARRGLAVLAQSLGLGAVFEPGASATLRLIDQTVRYVGEAHDGDALHLQAAIEAVGETDMTVIQVLLHSASGRPSAILRSRIRHVTARDDRAFAWSARVRQKAEALIRPVPSLMALKSLVLSPPLLNGSIDVAEAMAMQSTGLSIMEPIDCDPFGWVRADAFMGWASDAGSQIFNPWHQRHAAETGQVALGRVMLEGHLVFGRPAFAGQVFDLRSGLSSVTDKVETRIDWFLDPAGGAPFAVMAGVFASFDLSARKITPLPDPYRAEMRQSVIPNLWL
ncbi:MAG: thioesterase family protein [Asticcacaulis sp.]